MAKGPGKGRRDPLFDHPEARANYSRACQLTRFTIDESASLLMGLSPEYATAERVNELGSHQTKTQYRWIQKVLMRAFTPEDAEHGVVPSRLVDVATKSGLQVPKRFRSAVDKAKLRMWPASALEAEILALRKENAKLRMQLEEPPPKSKRSLQIIAVTATHEAHKYTGTLHSHVPGKIADASAQLGMPITQPVVSTALREAIEDLQPVWPKTVEE